jgi:hypothetical protein
MSVHRIMSCHLCLAVQADAVTAVGVGNGCGRGKPRQRRLSRDLPRHSAAARRGRLAVSRPGRSDGTRPRSSASAGRRRDPLPAGQRLGAHPDAQLWGVPLNRFRYQRLGPEPEFPVTVLAGEGGSDQIWVDVLCTPAGSGPYHRPGPPWQVHTTISLSCDSDPTGCGGHQVDAQTSPPVETPLGAATEVQAATAWLLQRLADETEDSLRKHDPNRMHPPAPRRRD